MNIYISLLFAILRAAFRAREDVALENLALRHQLAVMARSARRLRLDPTDRLLWCWLSRRWSRWRPALVLVQPDTVVRCTERRGDATGHGGAGALPAGRGSRRR